MNLELIPADTTLEAWKVQIEIYRRMSPLKRLQLAFRMSNSLRQVVIDGVRSRHPEFNKEQMQRAVLYLMQGKEIFEMVYPGVQVEV